MEELFASLAISGASIVGKAAFSLATNHAMKSLTSFKPKNTLSLQLSKLQERLVQSISIIQPSVDLLELSACKTSANMEILVWTNDFKARLKRFASSCLDDSAFQTLLNLDHVSSGQEFSIQQKIHQVGEFIAEIEKLVPFINLSLSAASFNSSQNISSSSLLKASHYLQTSSPPKFTQTLYSLFKSNSRSKDREDWTWKETFPLANTTLDLNPHTLIISESFNDGRHHEDDDKPSTLKISVENIQKLYFATCGALLRIGDSDPVLLIKYTVGERIEWIGLQDFKPGGLDDSDSESETEVLEESTEGISHWNCSEERLGIYLGNEADNVVGVPVGSRIADSPFKVQKTPVKKVMKQGL